MFEKPDLWRQSELMEGVHAAKEKARRAALWLEDAVGSEVAEAYSSVGPHAEDFLLPPLPGTLDDKVLMIPGDEFVTALRARLRNEYPALLPRFQRERGVAQHCSHQYSGWGTAGIVSFARTVQRTSGELASS